MSSAHRHGIEDTEVGVETKPAARIGGPDSVRPADQVVLAGGRTAHTLMGCVPSSLQMK